MLRGFKHMLLAQEVADQSVKIYKVLGMDITTKFSLFLQLAGIT